MTTAKVNGPSLDLELEATQEPPEWEPDDPDYELVPTYTGQEHLELWQARLGKIQPRDHLNSLHTLQRLHCHCKRSLRELTSLIEHVAAHKFARDAWGTGRSPAGWLYSRNGDEPIWRKVRANWLAAGGKFPRLELAREEVLARSSYQPVPPPPAWDPACQCYRGRLRVDGQRTRQPCPDCALGAWVRDYDTA